MPMLCFDGTFRVLSAEPDGDSIRFVPTDPGDWKKVPGPHRVRANAQGGAQLRLDGIDALETHYAPRGGHSVHQPLHFADAAAAELLKWLGFRDVVREGEKVTSVRSDDMSGFVLTRTADTYGRCVALIGRGDAPVASANELRIDRRLLRKTANHRLVSAGLVYPTFYSKLYVDLREELTKQAAAARQGSGKGLFADDATQKGVQVAALSTLTDQSVILPKLFRRLVDYLHLNGDDPSLAGFKSYLAQRDDRLYIISAGQKTGLDTIIDVTGQVVKLTHAPEDLIFDEQ